MNQLVRCLFKLMAILKITKQSLITYLHRGSEYLSLKQTIQSELTIGRMYPLSAQSSTAKEKWYLKEVFLVFVL